MTDKINDGSTVAFTDKPQRPFRLTTKLLVKLCEQGLLMLNNSQAQPKLLDYGEIAALSEIDRGEYLDLEDVVEVVSGRTGANRAKLEQFLRFLRRNGRLRRRLRPIPRRALNPSTNSMHQAQNVIGQGVYCLQSPLAVRLCNGEYQFIDHDGRLVVALDAEGLIALSQFARPTSIEDGLARQRDVLGRRALDESQVRGMLQRLKTAGLLFSVQGDSATETGLVDQSNSRLMIKESFARQAAEQDEREARRQLETGVYRSKVIPVSFGDSIPAALGLVVAYAKAYQDGALEEAYDFRFDWFWDDDRLAQFTARPAIYLFSNYLWSHEKSIVVSEKVKARSPGSITIHGGPDTPKYEQDAREYFEKYPHVDIIIRGEGEASAAETLEKLANVIGAEEPDLSVLKGVEGISYRYKGEVFRNPDRPRIADLDTIPSPYLMGLFDVYEGLPFLMATLETNRGCPYGCTFCDWGSATTSKIRKFDLDRVFDELTWCSKMQVQTVSQADANFGVFARDVEIARHVAELKKATGYPEAFGGSYAKNSTKYLEEIISIMADAGILTQGVLSLQTMDGDTLTAINRSNIKTEKYDALANEMRSSNLQLSVELMMGLPGATLESFVDDLQQCIDRDIQARINHTTMLVNAPMNNPEYRDKYQIETGAPLGPGKMPVLVSTSTYTRDDIEMMKNFRQLYILFDNFAILRICARFFRQQTGSDEMTFYRQIWALAGQENPGQQQKWPLLNIMANYGQYLMAPPFSWALFYDEVREFMVEECGIKSGTALDAILAVQHALMPSHGRSFPYSVDLQHDVAEWHTQMLQAKSAGHWKDWHLVVPPLSSFGPAKFDVNDVEGSVTKALGCALDINASGVNWDMDSKIGRARVALENAPAFLIDEDVITYSN